MQIYYQDERATLYHGDCRDVLPALPKASVHVIVTDPPYGQDYRGRGRVHVHDKIIGDDGSLDVADCLKAAARVLSNNRHLYSFGPSSYVTEPYTAMVELIWDKTITGIGVTMPWGKSHEPINFAVYEPSRANREKGSGSLTARLRRGSVLRVPRTNGIATKRHPTEKPVLLLRQLIESSTVWGETVLDPFVGVGSTLVAAALEGRRGIGIEADERYCEIAADRLTRLQVPSE